MPKTELRPLAAPVYRLKDDAPLRKTHKNYEIARRRLNEAFTEFYAYFEAHGIEKAKYSHFSFYNPEYFGFSEFYAPKEYDAELRVPKKGFRAFKKRSQTYTQLKEIFDKYGNITRAVENNHMCLVVSYRQFNTGMTPVGGCFMRPIVKFPQVFDNEYYIGGEGVKTDDKEFIDNYEPMYYRDYLDHFAEFTQKQPVEK